jgi:hypothetical protein
MLLEELFLTEILGRKITNLKTYKSGDATGGSPDQPSTGASLYPDYRPDSENGSGSGSGSGPDSDWEADPHPHQPGDGNRPDADEDCDPLYIDPVTGRLTITICGKLDNDSIHNSIENLPKNLP